jgi:hypothetical protein
MFRSAVQNHGAFSARPHNQPMWPSNPTALISHFVGGGTHPLDIVDAIADTDHNFIEADGYVTISTQHICLDAPITLTGRIPPSLSVQSRFALCFQAWLRADRPLALAYAAGRASASPTHSKLAVATRFAREIPYTLTIAMRALRPDIQQFVAQTAFILVTSAPTHAQIDQLFEDCLAAPLVFTLHSKAWAETAKLFKTMGCSAIVVKKRSMASIVLDTAFLATTRRDLILIVLGLLHTSSSLGPSLSAIAARYPWLNTVATLPN